jgi:hypothetical protein
LVGGDPGTEPTGNERIARDFVFFCKGCIHDRLACELHIDRELPQDLGIGCGPKSKNHETGMA